MINISQKLNKLKDLKVVIILSFFILVLLLLLLVTLNLSTKLLIILLVAPTLITLLLNFQTIYKIFIISIFYEFGIYYFYLPTLIFPFVVLSFLINFSFNVSEIKNPILLYFSYFLISIVPSYIAAIQHPESFYISYNLIGFISIVFITPIILTKLDDIKSIGILYLIACSLNAVYLIIMSFLSGRREFGFSGIMYVDLVGIGIVISYSGFLFYKNRKTIFGLITVLLVIALLFTQTRNAWLSSALIIILITSYYFIKREKYKKLNLFSVKKIAVVLISVILIIVLTEFIFPNVFSRVASPKVQTTEELATSMDLGSIATRFFIWQIAFNVFQQNPIIGTGFHSFRFVSLEYSNLDSFLYETFVYNLTPHTTVLALLADTGIIGFIGFIIFLYFTIRFFRNNLIKSKTQDQNIISFILFWCQIYILISMVMTDAWLWGTLHMLWAIILGCAVFLNSDIEKSKQLIISQ